MRFRLLLLLVALGLAVFVLWIRTSEASSPELHFLLTLLRGLSESSIVRDVGLTLTALFLVHLLGERTQEVLLKDLDDITARHKARKMVSWGKTTVFGMAALLIWGRRVEGLGVFLGMIGAGLTLSVQEGLLCIAGWILILTRKPFDLGDRIEIAGLVGDVVDVRVFYTSFLEVGGWCEGEQSTGRLVHLPNSLIFRGATTNYSQGFPFLWDEYSVTVTFESDWEKAKAILLEWAQEEAEKIESEVRRYLARTQEQLAIKYRQLSPIVYTSIADHGVTVTLRHLCPVRRRRIGRHEISEHILRRFQADPRIELAYPTTRFFRPETPDTTPKGDLP